MAQKVDPFIPVHNRAQPAPAQRAVHGPLPLQKLPQGQYGQHLFQGSARAPKLGRSVDGLKSAKSPPNPHQAFYSLPRTQTDIAPQRQTTHASSPKLATSQHTPQPLTTPQKRPPLLRRVFRKMQLPLLMLAAIGAGLLAQTLIFGEILVAAYAIFALIRRISSRTTFLLALLTIVCIIVLLLIRTNNALAANFAVYAFLLLLVGTVTLGREIRQGT